MWQARSAHHDRVRTSDTCVDPKSIDEHGHRCSSLLCRSRAQVPTLVFANSITRQSPPTILSSSRTMFGSSTQFALSVGIQIAKSHSARFRQFVIHRHTFAIVSALSMVRTRTRHTIRIPQRRGISTVPEGEQDGQKTNCQRPYRPVSF